MDWTLALLLAVVAAILAGNVWLTVKHSSWKGALFGAQISRTVGEVPARGSRWGGVSFKVHQLESADSDRAVAVELVAKGPMSYQMLGASLSAAATRDLIAKLEEACGDA